MAVACGTNPLGGPCRSGGKSYRTGDTFPSADGCNTCSCSASGVACTTRGCLPDAGARDAADAPDAKSDASPDANNSPDAISGDTNHDTNNLPDGVTADADHDAATADAPPGDGDADAAANPGCVYAGHTYAVGDGFPSGDGCNTCSCAAGSQIACTLRACVDAGPSTECSVGRTYAFWQDGGLRAYSDRATLTPPRTFTVARDHFMNAPPSQCARELPCSDPAGAGVAEIQQALAHPDVAAALALATKPFYGTDTRPVDGSVFVFERDDQRGFTLGTGTVPAGLRALADLLSTLQAATLATPACTKL